MATKINRYYSNEAGPFTKTGINKFNIDIPSSVGFSDLQNSALVLRMKCQDAQESLVPYTFLQADGIVFDDVQGAQSLIRNAKVTSDRYGVLNEQLRQNVVSANMDWYRCPRSVQDANVTFGHSWAPNGCGIDRASKLAYSPFLLTQGSRPSAIGEQNVTTTAARLAVPEIRIPLRHLDRLADGTRQFPNLVCGNLRYHVELENDLDVMHCAPFYQLNSRVQSVNDITTDGNGEVPFWDYQGFVGEAQSQYIELTLSTIPLYVGMPIQLTVVVNAASTTTSTTIASIWVDADTKHLRFTTAEAMTGYPADTILGGIEFYPSALVSTPQWEILEASIELLELQLSKPQMQSAMAALEKGLTIPFYDLDLVVQQMSDTSDYNQILQSPPNSVAVIAFTPAIAGIVSKLNKAASYRYSIDGLNTTDRDIVVGAYSQVGKQLHQHRLIQAFTNMGLTLRRFDAPNNRYAQAGDTVDHLIFPQILPLVPKLQNVQLRIKGSAAMPGCNVFNVFVISRQLQINKAGVVIQ